MDAGQLRALQDWFLKYELKTVANVAEVATVGGMVRQYQVLLDPVKPRGLWRHPPGSADRSHSARRIRRRAAPCSRWPRRNTWSGHQRLSGHTRRLPQAIPLSATAAGGVPVRLGDVATHPDRPRNAPWCRRVERRRRGGRRRRWSCARARTPCETIAAVKAKLALNCKRSLPPGVEDGHRPTTARCLINRADRPTSPTNWSGRVRRRGHSSASSSSGTLRSALRGDPLSAPGRAGEPSW